MGQILELGAPSKMVKRTPEMMGDGQQKWSAKKAKWNAVTASSNGVTENNLAYV